MFVIVIYSGRPLIASCEEYVPVIFCGYSDNEAYVKSLIEDYNCSWLPKAIALRNEVFDGHEWKSIGQMLEIQREKLKNDLPPPFPIDFLISASHADSYASYYLVPALP
jgi:hypothetical protein